MIRSNLVATGCTLESGDHAADWVDYPGGHADYWERWQDAGENWLHAHNLPVDILSSEYDDHPRGRILYDLKSKRFILYADERLQNAPTIRTIKAKFGLLREAVTVRSDLHYRAPRCC